MPRFIFALICCALSLHASPTPTIKTWLQEFLNAQKPEQLAHFSTSHLEFAPYTLIGALAQVPSKKGACVGVLYQGQLFKGFCVRGFNSLKLSKEQGKLRLELVNSTPATPTMAPKDTGYTLSFALKHGTFYLTSLAPLNQSTTYETTAPIYAMGAINDKLLATLSTPATPTYASPKEFAPTLPKEHESTIDQAAPGTRRGDYTVAINHTTKEQAVQIQKVQRRRECIGIKGTGSEDVSANADNTE
ncbi:hypothetical protein [Helicobacter heilmannii]|uniref:hypothetical protein n=1 Tax=Helicobacter heilmannii TaxID=35817 RepID=UPI000CF0AEB4|nr:hypothetical protein [Helicobacter heilmannii]